MCMYICVHVHVYIYYTFEYILEDKIADAGSGAVSGRPFLELFDYLFGLKATRVF